jgi:transposase
MIIIGVDYHERSVHRVCRYRNRRRGRTAIEPQRSRSREVLSGTGGARGQRACGNGSHGYSRWFERLLAELEGIELWIGDAAEIKTKRVRKQKTDRNDAALLLKLLLEDNFPTIWIRVRRIVIYGSCSGIGTEWYRCGRGS